VVVAAFLERAEFLAERGWLTEAAEAYQSAINADSGSAARCAYGCFLIATQQYRAAIEQFTGLLDAARGARDSELLAFANHHLAVIFRELEDWDLAAGFQRAVLTGQDSFEAADLTNLACEAVGNGRLRLAAGLVRQAMHLEPDEDADDRNAANWGTLGLIAGTRGQLSEAIRCLLLAYRRHGRQKDWRGMGIDLLNLAEMYARSDRRPARLRALQRAALCFEQAHAPVFRARAEALLETA
jgi:tetratricopeptide (TPR) repeat protein